MESFNDNNFLKKFSSEGTHITSVYALHIATKKTVPSRTTDMQPVALWYVVSPYAESCRNDGKARPTNSSSTESRQASRSVTLQCSGTFTE